MLFLKCDTINSNDFTSGTKSPYYNHQNMNIFLRTITTNVFVSCFLKKPKEYSIFERNLNVDIYQPNFYNLYELLSSLMHWAGYAQELKESVYPHSTTDHTHLDIIRCLKAYGFSAKNLILLK